MRTEVRRFRVSGPALVGVVIGMAMIGMVALYLEVSKDLRLLHAATSDNVQWTISHAEVEYLGRDE